MYDLTKLQSRLWFWWCCWMVTVVWYFHNIFPVKPPCSLSIPFSFTHMAKKNIENNHRCYHMTIYHYDGHQYKFILKIIMKMCIALWSMPDHRKLTTPSMKTPRTNESRGWQYTFTRIYIYIYIGTCIVVYVYMYCTLRLTQIMHETKLIRLECLHLYSPQQRNFSICSKIKKKYFQRDNFS